MEHGGDVGGAGPRHISKVHSGSDPLLVPKSELLRGIISEKLSTAAREILAVVERTVADYEEEAAGLRQEIDRQKRQLELLLPRVTVVQYRGDLQSHEEAAVCEKQEEQTLPQDAGMEAAEGSFLPGNQPEEEEDEEPAIISELIQTDVKDPVYQIPSRSAQSKKTRWCSSLNIDRKEPLNLRIRILEDSETEVLSNNVFKKCPIWDLQCPHGLEEAAFLDLLRSTFPQLSAGKPFDTLITDRGRKLQPLRVKTLTPEEIYRAIKSIGNSALYIRLKKEEVKTKEEGEHLSTDPPTAEPVIMKIEETALHLSMSQQSVPDSKKIFTFQDLKTEDGEIESDVHFISDEDEGLAGYRESNPDYEPRKQTREEKSSSNKSDFQESTKGEHACNKDSSGENDKDRDKPERKTPKMRRKKEGWKNSKKIRSCTVCGVTYRNLGNLLKHTLNHPLNPQNICGACGKGFESEDNLKKHIRKHRKSYNCLHCDKSFFTRESLRFHILKVTGENLLECNVCSKTFPSQKRLNQHRWIHLENKPYRCDMCPQSFGLESRLRAHRKRHTSKVLFHTGETPYKCNKCERRFKSRNQLTEHMKNHSGIKDFICGVCGKGSSKHEYLKVHMRTHTGERPYKCSLCDKAFTQSPYLKKHMKTHQTEESPAIPPATEDGSFSPK